MGRFIRFILQAVGALTILGMLGGVCLLAFAGYWMNVSDEPIKADYILPLAGDKHRIIKAAELYRKGYAPTILISNHERIPPSRIQQLQWKMGYPNYTRKQYNDLLFPLLGATTARREEFGKGHVSTVEEAEALRAHLGPGAHRILIVTSPYHARRSKMVFEDILPGCVISVVTTEEGSFGHQWWKDQRAAQNLVLEFAKTIHYMLGGVYRSTDPS